MFVPFKTSHKTNMNVAKNIANNVIKLAPSGPVSWILYLEQQILTYWAIEP